MTNVILCGGNGTRLWPISRTHMPKQFTKLTSKYSLFQDTILRNKIFTDKFLIVCNEHNYFVAKEQISDLIDEFNLNIKVEYIIESIGRNTAAAIIIASLYVHKDEILLVTPSDHKIENEKEYKKSIHDAILYSNDDFISIFGIKALHAHTGYGYIKANNDHVKKFYEKPNIYKANEYVVAGYFWNSGMFCFKAENLLQEAKKHAFEVYDSALYTFNNSSKDEYLFLTQELMQGIPDISIDYAIMEKSNILRIVRSDFSWNDLGCFDALYDEMEKEQTNAISYKKEKPLLVNSSHNLVLANSKKVVLSNVDDLVVVDTIDALLIAKKGKSEDIKQIVTLLNKEGSSITEEHPLVHRPWGTYNLLETKDNYKFKTILVKPNNRLSLQKHYHRNEHWIVLQGTATVTIGKNTKLVRANESVYIPMGKKHRLSNEGKINLLLIEVQVGDYLEEDDIVRYKDDYKRIG
jgi:mannose-1-phosphate guanylyltransferase